MNIWSIISRNPSHAASSNSRVELQSSSAFGLIQMSIFLDKICQRAEETLHEGQTEAQMSFLVFSFSVQHARLEKVKSPVLSKTFKKSEIREKKEEEEKKEKITPTSLRPKHSELTD